MLEVLWTRQKIFVFISRFIIEKVTQDVLHHFGHAVLLGDRTVVLYGQDHRVAGGVCVCVGGGGGGGGSTVSHPINNLFTCTVNLPCKLYLHLYNVYMYANPLNNTTCRLHVHVSTDISL